jgi:hypothetical protein
MLARVPVTVAAVVASRSSAPDPENVERHILGQIEVVAEHG